MTLANRIQTLRKQSGLSQEALAEKLGVTRQAVSKWESEQSAPDMENIIAISDLFEVSTDYLLKGKEQETATAKSGLRIDSKNEIPDLIIFVSSILNIIGVATGYNWMMEFRDSRFAYSFIFVFAATLLFAVASRFFDERVKENKKRWFVNINIWLYAAYSWCFFEFIGGHIPYITSAIIHFVVCVVILVPFNLKAGKEKNPNKKLKRYVKTAVVFSVIQVVIALCGIAAFVMFLAAGEDVKTFVPALLFSVIYLAFGIKGIIQTKQLL